jgi:hypothetical protein
MLTCRCALLIAGCAIAVTAGGTMPAFANGYGGVDCSQDPSPYCQLGAGTGGNQGGEPRGGDHQPGRRGSGHEGQRSSGNNGSSGDSIVGGGSGLANCSYVPSNYQPPAGAVTAAYRHTSSSGGAAIELVALSRSVERAALPAKPAAPKPGQKGSWYVWKCTTAGVTDGLYHPPVWIAARQPAPGGLLLPSPAQLAQMARNQLRLPQPTIMANPPGEQLVNLPSWLWLSGGWRRISATASVPGVSVTAVATPTSVTWSMGDGSTVTCAGAGTPFRAGNNPRAASPDCGHTYRTSSADLEGQAYRVSVTVHWAVTWAGAGQGGVFPDLTTTGNGAFRVAESQALNTSG